MNWVDKLRVDPLPSLLSADHDALRYFARRDLLGEKTGHLLRCFPHHMGRNHNQNKIFVANNLLKIMGGKDILRKRKTWKENFIFFIGNAE